MRVVVLHRALKKFKTSIESLSIRKNRELQFFKTFSLRVCRIGKKTQFKLAGITLRRAPSKDFKMPKVQFNRDPDALVSKATSHMCGRYNKRTATPCSLSSV